MNFLWIRNPVMVKAIMLYYLLICKHVLRDLTIVMDIVTKIELDMLRSIPVRSYVDKFELMPL